MMCLNTKGKYGKVTNTEIKWSIISKSVMMVIFVEFIDQLIDYPINRASLTYYTVWIRRLIWIFAVCACPDDMFWHDVTQMIFGKSMHKTKQQILKTNLIP